MNWSSGCRRTKNHLPDNIDKEQKTKRQLNHYAFSCGKAAGMLNSVSRKIIVVKHADTMLIYFSFQLAK